MLKKLLKFIFKAEFNELNLLIQRNNELTAKLETHEKNLKNVLENIDVSVDVHEYNHYSRNWAVISLQGSKTDYIKFVDLGNSELIEIKNFLRTFENKANVKIDATPCASNFLRIPRK